MQLIYRFQRISVLRRLAPLGSGLAALTCFATHLFVGFAAENSPDPKQLPPPERVVIPQLRGELKIDGDLNEPVWKRAALLKPFSLNDGSGSGREPTEVRAWYDDSALYLGWTCKDADIQATFTARDSKFWEEEVAEFFLTPKELTRYFELQWNPLGGAAISKEW
jgi:hypothetical protein